MMEEVEEACCCAYDTKLFLLPETLIPDPLKLLRNQIVVKLFASGYIISNHGSLNSILKHLTSGSDIIGHEDPVQNDKHFRKSLEVIGCLEAFVVNAQERHERLAHFRL